MTVGALEALEALPFESMSVGEAGAVLRAVAVVHGRADAVQALALAVFSRGNARIMRVRPIRRRGWRRLRNVGRDAKRAVKRRA